MTGISLLRVTPDFSDKFRPTVPAARQSREKQIPTNAAPLSKILDRNVGVQVSAKLITPVLSSLGSDREDAIDIHNNHNLNDIIIHHSQSGASHKSISTILLINPRLFIVFQGQPHPPLVVGVLRTYDRDYVHPGTAQDGSCIVYFQKEEV